MAVVGIDRRNAYNQFPIDNINPKDATGFDSLGESRKGEGPTTMSSGPAMGELPVWLLANDAELSDWTGPVKLCVDRAIALKRAVTLDHAILSQRGVGGAGAKA